MQRIRLGQSSLEISRLVFGSMGRSQACRTDADRILDRALDLGITSVDTAPLYDFGDVESKLGDALAGRRDRVELLSKVGLRWDAEHGEILFVADPPGGPRRVVRRDSRPAAIRQDVEESLKRLRTDRLDLVQIHQPDRDVPFEESLGALGDLVDEGKVLQIGVSNFEPDELERAIETVSTERGGPGLASHQIPYSLITRNADEALFPIAERLGLGVLAYSPLEMGALTDRMLETRGLPDAVQDRSPLFRPGNAKRIREAIESLVLPVTRRSGASVSQVALAWLLHRPGIHAPIVGASSPEQIEENAGATDLSLTPEELRSIGDGFARLRIDPGEGFSRSVRARQLAGRIKRRLERLVKGRN